MDIGLGPKALGLQENGSSLSHAKEVSQLGGFLLGPDIYKSQEEIVYVHIKGEGHGRGGTASCLYGPLLPRNNVGKDQLWAQTCTSKCLLEERTLQAPIPCDD